MKKTEQQSTVIGTAALEYDESGKLEAAVFYPKISVNFDDIRSQLGNCKNKTIDEVKQSAQLLLATFFNKLNDIELRDMETTEIEANVVSSDKYVANQSISKIEIEFIYKQK